MDACRGHRPTVRRTPAKGPGALGEQRRLLPAQEPVEEREQVRAFGRECRGPVDVADLRSDPFPADGFARISSGAKKTRSLNAKC